VDTHTASVDHPPDRSAVLASMCARSVPLPVDSLKIVFDQLEESAHGTHGKEIEAPIRSTRVLNVQVVDLWHYWLRAIHNPCRLGHFKARMRAFSYFFRPLGWG
jgi:hypothetical protein